MSNFAISAIHLDKSKTKILYVKIHDFVVGRTSDVQQTMGLDEGKEASASTVASMIVAGGDIFEVVTFDSYNFAVRGDNIRVVGRDEQLESFNENGSTLQLMQLPQFNR